MVPAGGKAAIVENRKDYKYIFIFTMNATSCNSTIYFKYNQYKIIIKMSSISIFSNKIDVPSYNGNFTFSPQYAHVQTGIIQVGQS